MVRGKRGDGPSATGSGVLVALIALMIILYVLFLPPQDRANLLGDSNTGSGSGGTVNTPTSNVLFTSTVGTVYTGSAPSVTHDLPTVTVRALQQGSILVARDSVTASNNVFEKKPAVLTFTADPNLTKNAVLSFNIESKTAGNIIVNQNGEEVFNQPVQTRSVPPIALGPLAADNTISLEASSVGFAFWRSNTYTLTNVKVTADVTDLTDATTRQGFTLSENELGSLDSAQLSFVPICNTEGKITIAVNDNVVYQGTPDCGGFNTLELAPSKLAIGDNSIVFSTQNADIVIDRGSVITKGKAQDNRVFSFSVNPTLAQGKTLAVHLFFADSNDKSGIVKINGNTIPFTGTSDVVIPITGVVQPGTNTLQFEATSNSFELVKFDVLLQ